MRFAHRFVRRLGLAAIAAATLGAAGCGAAEADRRQETGPAGRSQGRTAAEWVTLLGADDPQERQAAIDALAEWGRRSPAVIEALLARTDQEAPTHAALALVHVGTPAIPALVARLRDPDPGRRYTAAWTLKEMGPLAATAVGPLIALVRDHDPDVVDVALDALFVMEVAAAPFAPELARILEAGDTRPPVKERLEALLEELGAGGKAAEPAGEK